MNTTNTKETIKPKEKQKATRFLGDLDLRDYFAVKANDEDIRAVIHRTMLRTEDRS